MIRLGVVGCGWVSESVHLPALQRVSGIKVLAASDIRDERLQYFRRRFGINRLYLNWHELVTEPGIDAVLVATPADQHADIVHGVLEQRKHVLVEKPLSLTLAEAEKLAADAKTRKVVAMVGFNYRFHPLVVRLREAIVRGDLGRPFKVFITLTSMTAQRKSVTGYEAHPHLGGGVFYDKAVHALDILRFLFDCEVATAQATCRSETHEHDFANLELEMENGVHVSGLCADQMLPDCMCLVLGDGGKAMINLTRPTGLLLYRKTFACDRLAKFSSYTRQAVHIAGALAYFATARGRLSSYLFEWEHFIHAVEGRVTPRPNFEDGVAVTRTLQALLESLPSSP